MRSIAIINWLSMRDAPKPLALGVVGCASIPRGLNCHDSAAFVMALSRQLMDGSTEDSTAWELHD